MRAVLKSVDFAPDPSTLPGDPEEFTLRARMGVGPPDGPRANTDSDWWTLYRRESHRPGEPSNEASVWCFRIAHVGLAVLLIAFLALVIASALSFLGLVDS